MTDDVLKEAKEAFELASERESDNRKEALDDLRFARLAEQWPDGVRQQREREGRPCLTVNRLPAFIRQVVNDARQNKPSIKVHPVDSAADVRTAEIYNGLIRNIEVSSRAGVAYDTALDFAVTMGFGYFRINTHYACEDNFDLDVVIKRIANPFSVYGDPYSTEADSSDWNSAFVTELMTREQFRSRYRGADEVDWDGSGYERLPEPWRDDERILVAEFFQREAVKKTILLLSDQSVVDEEVYAANRETYDAARITVAGSRVSQGHKVTQRILTGAEVLETNKWAGKFIPIVPVYGDEVNVEGKRYFRSLVRDAKDPARMFNFWRTASTELVALAPKAPFIGPKGSFTTDAAKWATANVESHAFIEYDDKGVPPQRQPFAGVPAGALQEALNAADDIKAIIGIYDAGLGARSNETSGRAILARQREGDVSTFHFIDNLARAIEHAGRILIDLIPFVYTGKRIVRVLGPQNEVSAVPLNTPVQWAGANGAMLSHVYDLSRGKYDLTVETGPSFTTRREEAANQMTELIRAYPAAAPVLGDLLAKNLDWPEADEIAKRLQMLMAAQQGGGAAGGAQAAAVVQRLQQQIAMLAAQLQAAQNDKTIEAAKAKVDAFKAETERLKVAAEIAHRNAQHAAGGFVPTRSGAQPVANRSTFTARRTVPTTAPASTEQAQDDRFVTPRPAPMADPNPARPYLEVPNPGAIFDDFEAAAKDIHGLVNPVSKAQNLEYGWRYYFDNKTGKIGYTDPVPIGKTGGSNLDIPPLVGGKLFDPTTITELGLGHTHGDYVARRGPNGPVQRATRRDDPTSDHFSRGGPETDLGAAQRGLPNRIYTLGTPSGHTLKLWHDGRAWREGPLE